MQLAVKRLAFCVEKYYDTNIKGDLQNGRGWRMKITLQQVNEGKEEVIIKYREMTEEIDGIIKYIEGQGKRLLATKDGQQVPLRIGEVIYAESVDGATYVYTESEVYKTGLTLALLEGMYADEGFFRCSKSMVINIYCIHRLKSMPEKRIDVTMNNGEHVIISRHYAKTLRSILRGDAE